VLVIEMNSLRVSLAALLIALIGVLSLGIPGPEKTLLPPALNESSSLAETLEWLNKNAFPHARVGLKFRSRKGPKSRFGVPQVYHAGGERIFSEGFHVTLVNSCQVLLTNEQVTIVDARNPESGGFYRFITQKNGQRELTPQLATVFLSLDRMSDKRGKRPHLLTKDHKHGKSGGWWQASYEQHGFFNKMIFDAELTPAEQPQTKELGHFDYLSFTFESRELAEQFDAAFRRAIKICANK
jgi:hypothetical protein